MHEMGVVIRIVQTADEYAQRAGVPEVKKLTVEIGEASSVMPRYVDSFFYDVIPDYPTMQNCELEIEQLPAKAFCLDCGCVFHPGEDSHEEDPHEHHHEHHHHHHEHTPSACPECGSTTFKLIEGNTILIKSMEVE